MTYAVWDIETTTRSSFKRKGNPFDPENKVVMSGWKKKGGTVVGEYFGAGQPDARWFTQLLEGTTLLIGFNIKFDLLYALRDPANLAAWMKWVAAGGNVWDCQLAEYLLNGMVRDSHMLSLDEVAPTYGGNVKFDEVKALWAAGVDTLDIDPTLLRRYLCGEKDETTGLWTHGDIGNTELIFLGQLERARKVGQVKSILLNMGSLLCTIEMERNGMAVDLEEGKRLAAELAVKLEQAKQELAQYLPADLPFEFKWTSRPQLSALIFGGAVKYQKRIHQTDEQGQPAYAQKKVTGYVLTNGEVTLTPPEQDVQLRFDYAKYGSGKNKGEYKTKQVTVPDLDKPKLKWEDFYYQFPRMTEPKKEWESATEGVWSVAADVIKELGGRGIPFLDKLAEVTSITKDLGTYYIVTDEETGESKGMLTLVQPDGIIHHSLNHTSTVTARFSSSNPNLQNIPKEGKSLVKTVFVSRFADGKIIQSDFTALEVYVQAILTKCVQLIEDLKAGLDMHCVRVAQSEGMDYDEVFRLAKIEGVPEWDKKRTKAKVFSFQRAYGAGVQKIADTTGMAVEEVEALVRAEMERYPEIEPYYEMVTKVIQQNRKPTSRFVPHPEVRGAMCQLGRSWFRTPDNKLYCYDEQPSPGFLAKKGILQSFSPTEIKNYVVQGTGGEWAKAAMWLAVRYFYHTGNFRGLAVLVNQVHDALYADADSAVVKEAATALHACMLAASEFIEWWFGWEIPVPVPSDTVAGNNMMDESKIDVTAHGEIRQWLRTNYMQGYVPSFETK